MKLNNTSISIPLTDQEMQNLEGYNLSLFVTKLYVKLSKKYTRLRFTGTWGMKENKLLLFFKEREEVLA